jgi:hypothetical protein
MKNVHICLVLAPKSIATVKLGSEETLCKQLLTADT